MSGFEVGEAIVHGFICWAQVCAHFTIRGGKFWNMWHNLGQGRWTPILPYKTCHFCLSYEPPLTGKATSMGYPYERYLKVCHKPSKTRQVLPWTYSWYFAAEQCMWCKVMQQVQGLLDCLQETVPNYPTLPGQVPGHSHLAQEDQIQMINRRPLTGGPWDPQHGDIFYLICNSLSLSLSLISWYIASILLTLVY